MNISLINYIININKKKYNGHLDEITNNITFKNNNFKTFYNKKFKKYILNR